MGKRQYPRLDNMGAQPFESKQIFVDSRDILTLCHEIAAAMPKNYRHTTGQELIKSGDALTRAIAEAYSWPDTEMAKKLALIAEIPEKTRAVLIVLRVVWSLRGKTNFSAKAYGKIVPLCVAVFRQAGGWLKYHQGRGQSGASAANKAVRAGGSFIAGQAPSGKPGG